MGRNLSHLNYIWPRQVDLDLNKISSFISDATVIRPQHNDTEQIVFYMVLHKNHEKQYTICRPGKLDLKREQLQKCGDDADAYNGDT